MSALSCTQGEDDTASHLSSDTESVVLALIVWDVLFDIYVMFRVSISEPCLEREASYIGNCLSRKTTYSFPSSNIEPSGNVLNDLFTFPHFLAFGSQQTRGKSTNNVSLRLGSKSVINSDAEISTTHKLLLYPIMWKVGYIRQVRLVLGCRTFETSARKPCRDISHCD